MARCGVYGLWACKRIFELRRGRACRFGNPGVRSTRYVDLAGGPWLNLWIANSVVGLRHPKRMVHRACRTGDCRYRYGWVLLGFRPPMGHFDADEVLRLP